MPLTLQSNARAAKSGAATGGVKSRIAASEVGLASSRSRVYDNAFVSKYDLRHSIPLDLWELYPLPWRLSDNRRIYC